MKLIGNSNYELSTGKQIYAHGGIIGIDNELSTYTGFDGILGEGESLTDEELLEIAVFMIEKWADYAKTLK